MSLDKRMAYAVIWLDGSGWGIGVAVEDEPGYHPVAEYGPYTSGRAWKVVDGLNRRLGLDEKTAALIIASSMRGPLPTKRGRGRRRRKDARPR
jgi:hypothetical protein